MNFDVESARRQMIDQQVRAWDVLDDRVLETLAAVPREHFVPAAYREVAFADTAIPIGHGQSMLSPQVEGRCLQTLAIQREDDILEIGTGSGFFAACLARMGRQVRTLEIFADLAQVADRALKAHSVTNVTVESADASKLPAEPRYDVIALTASLPVYDARFERALKPGGRLFVVVGPGPVMEARLVTRVAEEQWARESLFETAIPPMINAVRPNAFNF
jgi:protein-L-isoaspartate(D-aspartate) O-methyltransferase